MFFGLDMILYFYFAILESVPVWGKVLISLALIAFFFRMLTGVEIIYLKLYPILFIR